MLSISQLTVHYGLVKALENISLEVREGEIVVVLGANGAGKTTLLRSIMGLQPATSGRIEFLGKPITGAETPAIVEQGLVMVPEGRRIFPMLSVEDNLTLGAYIHRRSAFRQDMERMYELFPRLLERRRQKAGTLSGGEQQMLAMGRALMARPKLVLMDEPSMGLAPILVKQIFRIIAEINQQGTTILLVEQNARSSLKLAHRAYVLETGAMSVNGPAAEVANNPAVMAAYLGGGSEREG